MLFFATVTVVQVSDVAIVVADVAADFYVDFAYGNINDFATSLSLLLIFLISRICSHFDQAPCVPCCKL